MGILMFFFYIETLGTRMRIMCLTPSTWKVWSDRMAKLKVRSRWCCAVLRLSCPPVSKCSKSLGCWCASRLLSRLSCLSFLCWAVINHLLYLWTRSGIVFYDLNLHCHDIMCQKGTSTCVNSYMSIVNPLQTYIQAQPQTKARLAPAAPAWLWASR